MTLTAAAAALRAKTVSSVELTTECLRQMDRHNPRLNAFVTITAKDALSAARAADEQFADGQIRGPLHGIPIAHKDLFDTANVRTTYGSKIFTNHVPAHDADIVSALSLAGAVSVGKTGLHELAYGITSANPHFGPVRNPWGEGRLPGGSSGGSAVAVRTGMAFMATGTDTGGSIRIPASFCGIAGLKPTYGLLSTAGCRPLSETLDTMGPLALTVEDVTLAMAALTGDRNYLRLPETDGLRIGVPENFFFDHASAEIADAVLKAADLAGGTVVNVRVDALEELVEYALAIILAEGAHSAADVLPFREQISADLLARFDQGAAQDPHVYLNAQRRRVAATRRFLQVFEECDVLITPASPTAAPAAENNVLTLNGVDYDLRLATTRLVRPINLIGVPALSLPGGLTLDGLPIGLQIIAPHGQDARALAVGSAIERALSPIIPTWN